MKVLGYDNADLWLEWLVDRESFGHYALDWPEHRDMFRDGRIRSLLADCPAEEYDGLVDTIAVVLGLPVEAVHDIAGG